MNLAGPIDFSRGGLLAELVAPQHFDVDAIATAGNVAPMQMQSGFLALRPTGQISKWFGLADRGSDPAFREAFGALETWASDNVPFPAAAYVTYIKELYQENRLVTANHAVRGKRVDLGAITCPVLTIVADKDTICPPDAALALNAPRLVEGEGRRHGSRRTRRRRRRQQGRKDALSEDRRFSQEADGRPKVGRWAPTND